MNYHYQFKSLLIGDASAGKSSIFSAFTTQSFSDQYIPTIGRKFAIDYLQIQDYIIRLQNWDSVLCYNYFNTLDTMFYQQTPLFFLVFDTTSMQIFVSLNHWIELIKENGPKEAVILLIGNKADLIEKRMILWDIGKEFADKHNIMYIDTSAKNSYAIKNIFYIGCEALMDKINSGAFIGSFRENGIRKGKLQNQKGIEQ